VSGIAKVSKTSAADALAAGIFAKPAPFVVEAYSRPDHEPIEFVSPDQLSDYIESNVSEPRGLAFVFVVYPDMGVRPVRQTIHLDPRHCPGQKLRYTWEGWGLISVQLHGTENAWMSSVAANSETRAIAWSSTQPTWTPPDQWNWKAVGSHVRRLQRILRKVT
jgi:hypothetical protein